MKNKFFAFIASFVLAVSHASAAESASLIKDGFALPVPNQALEFPADHGSHPQFKIEWWYVTGHLFSGDGRRFGFQATFFRDALPLDGKKIADENPTFGTKELHLAHMAVLDVSTGRFYQQERLNRDGWDAHAAIGRLEVQNGPWKITMGDTETMQLTGGIRADVAFRLSLVPQKPLVRFGPEGVSRKGADPSAASYYLTFPHLAVDGTLNINNADVPVHGQAWMDHEISSSQLASDQVGWDWACFQLTTGEEMMCYRMRHADGSVDPFSTLAWIDKKAHITHFSPKEFKWEILQTWKSPTTHAEYPVKIRLTTPQAIGGKRYTLVPLAKNQELTGSISGIPYWEGSCDILNDSGESVGMAFLELTGYAARLRM